MTFFCLSYIFRPRGPNFFVKNALESCWYKYSNATFQIKIAAQWQKLWRNAFAFSEKMEIFAKIAGFFGFFLFSNISALLLPELQISIIQSGLP